MTLRDMLVRKTVLSPADKARIKDVPSLLAHLQKEQLINLSEKLSVHDFTDLLDLLMKKDIIKRLEVHQIVGL